MRLKLMLVALLAPIIFASSAPRSFAQNQSAIVSPAGLPNCVQPFFDPHTYNWLGFQNNCSQPLNITWYWRANDHSGSSGVASPGRSVNTGFSRTDIESHGGGWEVYPCPANYYPVDRNGSYLTNGGSNPQDYACKHQ